MKILLIFLFFAAPVMAGVYDCGPNEVYFREYAGGPGKCGDLKTVMKLGVVVVEPEPTPSPILGGTQLSEGKWPERGKPTPSPQWEAVKKFGDDWWVLDESRTDENGAVYKKLAIECRHEWENAGVLQDWSLVGQWGPVIETVMEKCVKCEFYRAVGPVKK